MAGGIGAATTTQQSPNKQSAQFREFVRYVTRFTTGKGVTKKTPDLKEIFNCPEYRNFDIKKNLSVEIKEWIIPLGNSEERGIKMLLFIIPKN
jgi:hypothetical protein